jgi:hypothetical protein
LNRWKYTSTGHPQLSQDTPGNKKVHTTKDTIRIKGIASHDKHKTLGYHQSTEKPKYQQQKLFQDKISENIEIMKRTALKYNECNTYNTETFFPPILYTATLSSVQFSQAEKITEAIQQHTLGKKGFHGSTPLGIALGHKHLGILQMLDIYARQGAVKAIKIMKLNKTQNKAGQLFRITYLWWQYEI